jgi:hypothetical protein
VEIESLKTDQRISAAEAKLRGRPSDVETTAEELWWMAARAFIGFESDALQRDAKLLVTPQQP